ncbi:MAG: ferrous iron transport protein B [Erysipelotrichaceae bacterium]|nr:ferrous iron transport protein B [Erysipelotrichaceae bacterium]
MHNLTVGFIGNPNCGKTTLFNAYTGANLKVANWPGVTVERIEGAIKSHGHHIRLVDLPGTYSLTSYTMEEQVSRDFIMSPDVDVIVDVADASSLERSLYLTMQLTETGRPMVLALNMMDIVQKRGIELDLHRLQEILGIPVIPVTARKRIGLKTLLHAALHQHEDEHASNHRPRAIDSETVRDHAMIYSRDLEDKIQKIEKRLPQGTVNPRWTAIALMSNDPQITERYDLDLSDILDGSEANALINQKYDRIQKIMNEVLLGKASSDSLTEQIDEIVTRPFWGVVIFLLMMAGVFLLTFTLGDFLSGYLEQAISWFTGLTGHTLQSLHASDWLVNLICDGIIAGVGGIITFLPNIAILFIALALLEDSGYMARAAYVMNDIMEKLGLSGRAFIPMVLGFGCTVPAIMATRTLESKKDQRRVMFLTPFMSCSAKLPVYILFAEMFFAKNAMWAAYSMYVIGLLFALLLAWILHKMDPGKKSYPLLIELPAYKMPSFHTVYIYVWEKVKDFLTKAGTTIFIASILLWIVMHLGPEGYTENITLSLAAAAGKALAFFLIPCGLGFWQIAVALIAGLSAKEVVVSSTAVLFGISNITSFGGMQQLHDNLAAIGFGPLNAYCMMLFCLMYIPCAAALATIKRESGSRLFALRTAAFQLVTAWAVSALVYQIGSLLIH